MRSVFRAAGAALLSAGLFAVPADAAMPGVSVPSMAAWCDWLQRDAAAPLLAGLAFLALLLALINLWQGRVMLSVRRDMRRALDLAENRAAAADRAVAEAARERRPLVQMKALRLAPFSPGSMRFDIDGNNYLKSIRGDLWNEGRALGYVQAMRIECQLGSAMAAPLPADDSGAVVFGRKPLGLGEIWTPAEPLLAARLDSSFDRHLLTLYAWGWVRYLDDHGVVRRGGFAFEYVPTGGDSGEFKPCGASAHWYDVEEAA